MVSFADERLNALRREFGMLWVDKAAQGNLPPSARETADLFVRRMEAMRARLLQSQRALAGLKGKGPIEALTTLKAIEADNYPGVMQTIEEQAKQLRHLLGMQAPRPQAGTGPLTGGTGPLSRMAAAAKPGGTGPLQRAATGTGRLGAEKPKEGFLGMLKKIGEPATVETLQAAPEPEVPTKGRTQQAFEAAFELVKGVLEYVTPRLEVVKVALDTTGLPARKQEWEVVTRTLKPNAVAAGIPEPAMAWLPPLTKLFYQNMPAVQKAHMALVQWHDARSLHGEAERLTGAIAELPPVRREAVLGTFDLGKYRAAVYPISHLHVSFQGVSPLSEFFPAP